MSSANGGVGTQGITDADLPSDSMIRGFVYALNGRNKSQARIITTFVSAGTLFVLTPFDGTIASGDDFFVFGASVGTAKLGLTTNLTQVAQWFPTGTGANCRIVRVIVNDHDPAAPTGKVHFLFGDHYWNPESA